MLFFRCFVNNSIMQQIELVPIVAEFFLPLQEADMEKEKPHDLYDFMKQVTNDMSLEYHRIQKRAAEDPGTAGDQGEEIGLSFYVAGFLQVMR